MLTGADTGCDVDTELDSVCSLRTIVGRRPICDRPAAWAVRLACCGGVKVVCDGHRDIAASIAPRTFLCTACRATDPAVATRWPI